MSKDRYRCTKIGIYVARVDEVEAWQKGRVRNEGLDIAGEKGGTLSDRVEEERGKMARKVEMKKRKRRNRGEGNGP